MPRRTLPLLLLTLATACSPDLRPDDAGDGGAMPLVDVPGGDRPNAERVASRRDGAALVTVVDASASDQWVYLDLDRGEQAGDAMAGWDLAIQRFKVRSNGGVSGDGGVEIARLAGARFEDVIEAPMTGWLRDAVDGDDANSDPDYVFDQEGAWYAYDPMDHSLAPRDLVYVVRTTERRAVKLRMLGYYDGAGTSGVVSLRWQELASHDGGAQ
ncbi:MAG: HmuY family protein [Deltaproteobacteria bacterium]|nr:HmuY family protein [Myxococcales bacterium]MDP3217544.1 HmuY family protein [Deltaproteobacteria bacterium]